MHKFSPHNAHRLLDEERRKILPPEEILRSCGLSEGMTMVDVGCGSGFFTIPASKIVGQSGKVFAIDVQEEMIEKLKQNDLPENVIPILAKNDYEFPIDDKISDFTFLAFVTHENEDVEKFLNEVKRITKEDGKIVILEWKKQYEEAGPPYEERISQEELLKVLEKVGLRVFESGELNNSHYKIICLMR
ncbi:class I SAM-dependent methyltransferase [Candidatus Chrysopegis kryptomonas]|uniref:Methyltransferase domain-containing protein n=1 Tax=Candidatus Chryseopegocella kryptomonas TaxID=1633643 RepID=A0A0P1NUA1_9BACT|nr:methyltransferase domain-containing protein [Candidatus Chrysopegis kryptomonas]CUT02712.1 Methyltransferase domain-containing protein [Candidatus Chrysopegis kryptomonas]